MNAPLRRRDAEENRVALLDAAAALLADDPDASLEAIASAAGLSRRALYGHYAGREELVAATIELGAARLAGVVDVDQGTLPDPHPSVVPAESAPLALARLGARLWDAVENLRMLASFALRGPNAHRVAAALAPVRERLGGILESGANAGTLRSDIPVALLARLVERAAIAVLDEAVERGLSRDDGRRLVMLMTLSAAGLSATEAARMLAAESLTGAAA